MERSWWRHGVIYQIYPRSFADGTGDGVGDLPGIAGRLDHLARLGVDAVWLSPIYPSPMRDFGYDISDHTGVDPRFGTLADFGALVAAAHRRGLRVLLDYVPNHTSDEHPWFAESRSSRASPRRDWYLWRDPGPGGGPPNNWRSVFGGPAWTQDPGTGQWYHHAYLPEQPDLNWRNPAVRAAMLDVLRCWLDRGVDGFRVDALRQLLKDPAWRDNPVNPGYAGHLPPYDELLPVHSTDQDDVHAVVAELRAVVATHGAPAEERLMVGELYLPIERLVRYYGADGAGVQLPTNMHLISTPWAPGAIAALVERYEAALPPGAWPNWVLGNHDRSRIASRVGAAQARVAAALLLTLRGTPTIYYGDELGLTDVPVGPEDVQDPYERRVPGRGVGRDPVRAPMPWTGAANAGFCPPGARPWLPLPAGHAARSVEAQERNPRSMLALHRRLLGLRRRSAVLAGGAYRTRHAGPAVLAFERFAGPDRVLVALNLSAEPQALGLDGGRGRLLLSTHLDRGPATLRGELCLRGDEGLVMALAG